VSRIPTEAAVLPLLLAMACSSPQPRPNYVDRMHFVDDDAVEPVAPRRVTRLPPGTRIRRRRRPTALRGPRALGPPRCANHKQGTSESPGRANDGRLENGCLLPAKGPGWVRRNKAGWGTDRSVAVLQWALGEVVRLHRGTVPVVVGALSRENGGRLRPHRSHRSGRDIDIGYFAANNAALPHFRPMTSGNIDIEKTWTLIGAMLHTGLVHYVFVDYNLQALMVRYLEDEGTDARTLARVFQYPAGRAARQGIIRHARGHADHLHIRFRCIPEDGDECLD